MTPATDQMSGRGTRENRLAARRRVAAPGRRGRFDPPGLLPPAGRLLPAHLAGLRHGSRR